MIRVCLVITVTFSILALAVAASLDPILAAIKARGHMASTEAPSLRGKQCVDC